MVMQLFSDYNKESDRNLYDSDLFRKVEFSKGVDLDLDDMPTVLLISKRIKDDKWIQDYRQYIIEYLHLRRILFVTVNSLESAYLNLLTDDIPFSAQNNTNLFSSAKEMMEKAKTIENRLESILDMFRPLKLSLKIIQLENKNYAVFTLEKESDENILDKIREKYPDVVKISNYIKIMKEALEK